MLYSSAPQRNTWIKNRDKQLRPFCLSTLLSQGAQLSQTGTSACGNVGSFRSAEVNMAKYGEIEDAAEENRVVCTYLSSEIDKTCMFRKG